MLERVSSSAECAAQIFLRRLEAPVRSQRSLGLAFWRHGGDNIEVPAWWPMYLEDIRSRNQTSFANSKFSTIVSACAVASRCKPSTSACASSRTFSNTAPPCHNSATVSVTLAENVEHQEAEEERRPNVSNETLRATRKDGLQQPPKKRKWRKREVDTPGEETDKLEKAWNDFTTSGFSRLQASQLLRILAAGNRERDFDRAIRVFEIIPRHERLVQDYQIMVDISIRLNRYSFAIQTIKEAVSRKLNQETFFKFLALCISKSIWSTAATLWQVVGRQQAHSLHTASKDNTANKRNFAGKYISCFDVVTDLPSKIVSLTNRLQDDDVVLRKNKEDLTDLCQNLALVVVESNKVMNEITNQGLFAIFAIQQQLGINSKLHFAALATIDRMRDKGTKCQLATSIYNSFKSTYPDAPLPKWVLGTMLGIYTAGSQPPLTYRSILNDYKRIYGVPEDSIYLRVMKACAKLGEFNHVRAVFDEFCEHNQPKDADFLNPLIHAHAVVGNYEKAQAQFDNISAIFGFRQSSKNWNSLLLAYSRSSQPHVTHEKFKKMQQSDTPPDQYSWSILVSTATREGDTSYACNLVKQAQAEGILAPLAMTGAVVDSYLLNDRPNDALALVVQASKSRASTTESPIRLWNSLFRYYAFRSEGDAILRTQEEMKKFGVQADSMTYAALMTALVVQGRTQDAVQILRTLHFSQTIAANEFHYSILIYGFAKEKRHNLASIIYREMLEKFGRTSPSARLSMFHLQANKVEEEAARSSYLSGEPQLKPNFEPLMDTFEDVLENMEPADMVSPFPNPGFGRKSPRSSLKDVYLSSLVSFLHRNQAHDSSREIISISDKNDLWSTTNVSNAGPSWQTLANRLSLKIEASVALRDWKVVDKNWKELIEIALQHCVSVEQRESNSTHQSPKSHNLNNIRIIGDKNSYFPDMIFTPFNGRVLPAHRFTISRPLAQYIRALSEQQRHVEIMETVQTVRDYGFSLSSKNWNGLIQALCRSSNSDYRALAFELFEKHLLPNAPSWDVIRRGKWVNPSKERPRNEWDIMSRRKDHRKPRKQLEKLDPGLLMPSYYTVVHLASVWSRAPLLVSQDDQSERQRLKLQSPGTVKLVLQMPYTRDRVQGILVRGTQVIGDPVKRPRQAQSTPEFVGIEGSQLLTDQIPTNLLNDLKAATLTNDELDRAHQLALAEKVLGEIDRSRIFIPSKGRLESLDEQDGRIDRAQNRHIAKLQQIAQRLRQESQTPPALVKTMARGTTLSPPRLLAMNECVRPHQSLGQRTAIPMEIRYALRRVSISNLYLSSVRKARIQKSTVRTSSLAQRIGRAPHTSSSQQNQLIASTQRRRSKRRIPTDTMQSVRIKHGQTQTNGPLPASNANAPGVVDSSLPNYDFEAHLQRRFQVLQRTYEMKRSQMASRIAPSQNIIRHVIWFERNAKKARKELFAYRRKMSKI